MEEREVDLSWKRTTLSSIRRRGRSREYSGYEQDMNGKLVSTLPQICANGSELFETGQMDTMNVWSESMLKQVEIFVVRTSCFAPPNASTKP